MRRKARLRRKPKIPGQSKPRRGRDKERSADGFSSDVSSMTTGRTSTMGSNGPGNPIVSNRRKQATLGPSHFKFNP